jgi:hypothetical protein
MGAKKGSRADAVSKLRTGVSTSVVQTFDAASPSHLHAFIVGAVRSGCLVSFSRTQDGGAAVLTVLDDELPDGKFKDYFPSDEAVADIIEKFAGIYGDG